MERGKAYFYSGDYEHAVQDFASVGRHDPQNAAAYFAGAEASEKLGDMPAAIEDYHKVLVLVPANTQAQQALKRLSAQ